MTVDARLQLPDVTLVCVDTRTPDLALAAMRRCIAQVQFAKALLFTDAAALTAATSGIEVIGLEVPTVAAYSEFMLRGLDMHIDTSHVLVVQWDGYVLDAGQWEPGFLNCDYIGAPLRDAPPGQAVGNGGFSLRSKRLLQAMRDPAMQIRHPEDICICQLNRRRLEHDHGMRFADAAIAQRFSWERLPAAGPTFGFHGLFNMQHVMPAAELHALVQALPDALARGLDAHDLCRSLIAARQLDTAAELLAKRRRLGMRDRRTLRLHALLAWARYGWRLSKPSH